MSAKLLDSKQIPQIDTFHLTTFLDYNEKKHCTHLKNKGQAVDCVTLYAHAKDYMHS